MSAQELKQEEGLREEVLQLAENVDIISVDGNPTAEEKRELLKKTRIVKQTWSIQEIFQKIRSGKLNLSPIYQRNEIWGKDKQTAFIESLLMGIIIPPIYVVEVPAEQVLDGSSYEVVDGKQRLTTITSFLQNEFSLVEKYLEYFGDLFKDKTFSEIYDSYNSMVNEVLSSVLDIYVITANSPEFTKYDIFSRLNKGAEALKVNEIRKAIYRSELINIIDRFISEYTVENDDKSNVEQIENYSRIFSVKRIKRYDDYGRFYRSIAYYKRSVFGAELCEVKDYNSRPREMINTVLQQYQRKEYNIDIDRDDIDVILIGTIDLFNAIGDVSQNNIDYIIDSCIPFIVDYKETLLSKMQDISSDEEINNTFLKSPGTTSNVNARLKRVYDIIVRGNE